MMYQRAGKLRSLSVRRAWIEMYLAVSLVVVCPVALRKESVDRNDRVASGEPATFVGRSP